jgi:hypothetical protein
MPARTKGRAKFDFHGRTFLWWVDDDRYLRILSLDKKFVVAALIATTAGVPIIEVIGSEFPGIDPKERRPIRLIGPHPTGLSMGEWVHTVLRWAFDPKHELNRFEGQVQFF